MYNFIRLSKNSFLMGAIALSVLLVFLFSCSESQEVDSKNEDSTLLSRADREFFIYYVEWDGEWGRTSKKCEGWGLIV